jgi:hypothetical protein
MLRYSGDWSKMIHRVRVRRLVILQQGSRRHRLPAKDEKIRLDRATTISNYARSRSMDRILTRARST